MKRETFILLKLVFLFSFVLFLQACGGGGESGDDADSTTSTTAAGVFKYNDVSGLSYISGGQKGITKRNGGFTYEVGSPITFSIGNVTIGTTQGKSVITPADLVSEGGANELKANNIARFLNMLDNDGNPDNGIHISSKVRAVADTWPQVDFSKTNFSSELASIRTDCIAADGGKHSLPDSNTSKEHLDKTLGCINGEFCLDSELDMTLHLLPPLGEDSGNKTFDRTLTDYLKVSVCEVTSIDDCTIVEEFTSQTLQNHHKGLGFIKLQRHHYHVNWKVAKGSAGKEFEIHFTVAGLEIRYVTYTPPTHTHRTVPIKFTIDNNPQIRVRVLAEQGFTAIEIAEVLRDEFSLIPGDTAQLLSWVGYEAGEIVEALIYVFNTTAQECALILQATGYSAGEIGQALKDFFPLDALGIAGMLKDGGFGVSKIYEILTIIFFENQTSALSILRQIGFTSTDFFADIPEVLAAKYAPQLRFDKNAGNHETGFPMSAQDYFDKVIEGPYHRSYPNNDVTTLTDPNRRPPTYYKVFLFGNQIRILYWWYYGYQPGCDVGGVTYGIHTGDWERVIVILSEDTSMVAATTFYQHSGWYTRIRPPVGSFELYEEDHPIVYVGKSQHGSYHNQGGSGSGVSTRLSGCFYFNDWRNNGGRSNLWLDTWHNLKSMTRLKAPRPEQDSPVVDGFVGLGDGSTIAFDLDSMFVDELKKVSVSGYVIYPYDSGNLPVCEWDPTCDEVMLSNGSGTGGLDQIIFPLPPPAGAVITADWSKKRLERFNVTDNKVGTGDGTTTAFDLNSKHVHSLSKVSVTEEVIYPCPPGTPTCPINLSRGTGAGGLDQIIFLAPPPAGAVITVDWKKYNYVERWMHEEARVVNGLVGMGDGSTTFFDLDSRYVNWRLPFSVRVNDADALGAVWSDYTGHNLIDQILFSAAPPASGATITADWTKGDFKWGEISTHPMSKSNDSIGTILSCDSSGKASGCSYSECPPGYIASILTPNCFGANSFYRGHWTTPQTDVGLITP